MLDRAIYLYIGRPAHPGEWGGSKISIFAGHPLWKAPWINKIQTSNLTISLLSRKMMTCTLYNVNVDLDENRSYLFLPRLILFTKRVV